MTEIFTISFLDNIKVLIVAILIYAIIFSLLKTIKIFGDNNKIDSLIAFVTAIIVSFSGVVTYAISYAINWFVIIFFIIFLLLMILMFLGIKPTDITSVAKDNSKAILIAFAILFFIIVIKSFFALNNTFDTSHPVNNSYTVNTTFNTGVNDITEKNSNQGFFTNAFSNINNNLLSTVLFLGALGVFIWLIGN